MNLVTGATGHIGNVLVRYLFARGERVRAFVLPQDNLEPLAGTPAGSPIEVCVGDILDPASLDRAMQGVQHVFHLAGMISIMPGRDIRVHQVNVDGTSNILQAAQKAGVEKIIYTSSIHAIRRIPHGQTIDEQIPYDPDHAISEYDRSKAEATLIVIEAAQQGFQTVIACPTGVIGPYDFRLSEMGRLVARAVRGGLQWSVQGAAYDFVDVRDVVHGLVAARDCGRSGESYILSGEQTTLEKLFNLARQAAGATGNVLSVPVRIANAVIPFAHLYYRISNTRPLFTSYALETVQSNAAISHAKASQELGYSPRSLAESVRDTVQWLRGGHPLSLQKIP